VLIFKTSFGQINPLKFVMKKKRNTTEKALNETNPEEMTQCECVGRCRKKS
jgi:hypothetical protein